MLMGKVIIFSHTDLWPGYNDLDTSVMSMITNGIHHITKTTLYSRIIIIWYQHVCSILTPVEDNISYIIYLYNSRLHGHNYMVVGFMSSLWDQSCCGRDHTVVRFTTTYMQSVPITTKVVSSNPAHGEVYSIQHHVIKLVSDLLQVGGFSRYSGFFHQ